MQFIRKFNQYSFFKDDEYIQQEKDKDILKDEIIDNIEAFTFRSDVTSNKSIFDKEVENITETQYHFIIKERNGVFTIVYKDQVSAFTIKFFGNKILVNNNKKEEEDEIENKIKAEITVNNLKDAKKLGK